MSVPSELSSILTNANWTMYQTGAEDPPPQGSRPVLADIHSSTDPLGLSWNQIAPQQWTKHHVLEWIAYNVEESKFDARLLNLSCCAVDGATLCQFSHEKMLSLFGHLGQRLYHSLQELKDKYGAENMGLTWNIFDDLEEFPWIFPDLLSTVVVRGDQQSHVKSHSDGLRIMGDMTPLSDNGYESGSASLESPIPGTLRMPSSPESGGSDCEVELPKAPFPYRKDADNQEPERGEVKPQKRGRGRPRKLYGPFAEMAKSKHSPRGTHLWEFIRDILIHPEQNNGLMKWEDRQEGIFKFLKSEAVAQLWGQKKRNSSMTYEKLSRAMRYYYKREILERVDGRRLVYKFGKNSNGWKEDEVRFVK